MDSVSAIQELAIKNSIKKLDRLSTNVANANSIGYKSVVDNNGRISNEPAMIKRTSNDHDITAVGNNYFSISDGYEISFTKSMNIIKDENGFIRTSSGYYVMEQGEKVQISGGRWSINKNAEIVIDGRVAASLDVFESIGNEPLRYISNGLYSGDVTLSGSKPKVMVGFREMSNVNISSELLDIVNVQNQFKSQSVLLKSYNEMMDYSNNILK